MTMVYFQVKDEGTVYRKIYKDAYFFLFHVNEEGVENWNVPIYINSQEWAVRDLDPGEKFRIKKVYVPGKKLVEPEDGIYAQIVVSSSPQHIQIDVETKPKYHIKIISFGVK